MNQESRFINLETQLTHQEQVIENLSQVIYAQQQQIDDLTKKLTNLISRLQSEAIGTTEIGSANEKPPHY